jgi:hypothetical protein
MVGNAAGAIRSLLMRAVWRLAACGELLLVGHAPFGFAGPVWKVQRWLYAGSSP